MTKEKQATGVCTSFFLPPEIETEILSRLPVKSVSRFKCVGKSWRNLIESPTFITMHLNNFGKNNDGFLLYNCSLNQCFKQSYRVKNNNNGSDAVGLTSSTKWFFGESKRYIFASSNGLVCLTNYLIVLNPRRDRFRIHIWNPSTRKILELPDSDCGNISPSFLLGFGFCPKLNDYKVVKIAGCTFSYDSQPLEVQVYSLSTNSWKKITMGNPGWDCLLPSLRRNVLIINGASYWLGQVKSQRRTLIMAFKFDEEVFEEINLPNHHTFQNRNLMHLFITGYRNSLSLIAKRDEANVFDMWVMKQYGVDDSWVKQITIEVPIPRGQLISVGLVVMNFDNNGELLILIVDKSAGRLVSFNTMTNQIENQNFLYPVRQVISCKESLVSLPGGISAEFLEEKNSIIPSLFSF